MGIVFPYVKSINKSSSSKEISVSQRRALKPLTLRNRIFLSSLPIFNKKVLQ